MKRTAFLVRVSGGEIVHVSVVEPDPDARTVWVSDDVPDDVAGEIAGRLGDEPCGSAGEWAWATATDRYDPAARLVCPAEMTRADIDRDRRLAIAAVNARADALIERHCRAEPAGMRDNRILDDIFAEAML